MARTRNHPKTPGSAGEEEEKKEGTVPVKEARKNDAPKFTVKKLRLRHVLMALNKQGETILRTHQLKKPKLDNNQEVDSCENECEDALEEEKLNDEDINSSFHGADIVNDNSSFGGIMENSRKTFTDSATTDIYSKISARYPRSWGIFSTIYWMQKIAKKYKIYGISKGKLGYYSIKSVPEQLQWMKRLVDEGIGFDGREIGESLDPVEWKNVGKRRNLRIAEIIDIYPPEPHLNLPELYLVRWIGEGMATASFMPIKDLDCTALIAAFNAERKKKQLKDIRLWEHVPAGSRSIASARISPDYNDKFISLLEMPKNNNSKLKRKGRGKQKQLFKGNRHPALVRKWFKKDLKDKNSCLFQCLNSISHVFPRRMIGELENATTKEWSKFTHSLQNLFLKYLKNIRIAWTIYKQDLIGNLHENLLLLANSNDPLIVIYRGVGVAHCGLWKKQKAVDLTIYENLKDQNGKTESQTAFKNDLGREVKSIGILKIRFE